MTDDNLFIDYYSILQVSPQCDARTLEAAYRRLAKMYHPDHPETADGDRFTAVIEAYRALRNAEGRTEYDALHAANVPGSDAGFAADAKSETESKAALGDAAAHARILLMLYKARREDALNAGVPSFSIQEMLDCSDEHFEFHRWYLRSKGLVEVTEQGTLAITVEGVDHVISTTRTAIAEKLMIGQSGSSAA